MGLLRLAWKNIFGNAFRSVSVLLCAAVMAGLALVAVFVVRGAEASLNANLERLGADILVLPWGTMTEKIGGIRLMSAAIERWMPAAMMDKIAAVDGVAQVSPQQFITALNDSQYSPYPKMYLVAYDPQTDFALRPWLKNQSGTVPAGAGLAPNEAVAGAHVTFPEGGDTITLYGAQVRVVQRLVITETTIDDTLFVSFETAERITAWSLKNELNPLMVMPGTISAIMVKLNLESDPHEVAVRILDQVSGVVPLETPDI